MALVVLPQVSPTDGHEVTRLVPALEHLVRPMVHSDVRLKIGLYLDPVVAVVTLVWLLSCVGSDVASEVAVGLESRRTLGLLASERRVAGVGSQVHGELAAVLAPVGTDLAVVRPLVRVYPHVLPQGALVHRLVGAGTAGVWLVSGVHLHVPVQFVLPAEGVATEVTAERLLAGVLGHVAGEVLGVLGGEETAHEGALVDLPASSIWTRGGSSSLLFTLEGMEKMGLLKKANI